MNKAEFFFARQMNIDCVGYSSKPGAFLFVVRRKSKFIPNIWYSQREYIPKQKILFYSSDRPDLPLLQYLTSEFMKMHI